MSGVRLPRQRAAKFHASLQPGAGGSSAGIAGRADAAPPDPDGMNREERAYADHLEAERLAGRIRSWAFEPEKLLLTRVYESRVVIEDGVPVEKQTSKRTFYTPDFRVVMADNLVEFHEYKGGRMMDDSFDRLKTAASLHPYTFRLVRKAKGGAWDITTYSGDGSQFS